MTTFSLPIALATFPLPNVKHPLKISKSEAPIGAAVDTVQGRG
ncbi:MAG: hypothetical protein SOV03_06280 [Faecalibacterium sp.]|nr:hypothetical protein [Faecalibacterium sp.]